MHTGSLVVVGESRRHFKTPGCVFFIPFVVSLIKYPADIYFPAFTWTRSHTHTQSLVVVCESRRQLTRKRFLERALNTCLTPAVRRWLLTSAGPFGGPPFCLCAVSTNSRPLGAWSQDSCRLQLLRWSNSYIWFASFFCSALWLKDKTPNLPILF